MTIKAVAEELGVSRQHLSMILNGHHPMPVKHCKKIAKMLGVPYENLLMPIGKILLNRIQSGLFDFVFSDLPLGKEAMAILDIAVRFGFLEESSGSDKELVKKDLSDIFNVRPPEDYEDTD